MWACHDQNFYATDLPSEYILCHPEKSLGQWKRPQSFLVKGWGCRKLIGFIVIICSEDMSTVYVCIRTHPCIHPNSHFIYMCVCVKRAHPVYSPTCYITHLTTASSFYALYVLFVLNVGVLKWRCGCELTSIQALIFVTNVVNIFESCDAMHILLCWTLCL